MHICTWPLQSGQTLDFNVFGHDTSWNSVGGLYIFAYDDGQRWRAVYVGQTNDFSVRLPAHERWAEAKRLGATHVHARVIPQQVMRDSLEKSLIINLQPPLNEQYRGFAI